MCVYDVFRAVSLGRTHALGCQFLDGRKFLCGADNSRGERILVNTWDLRHMMLWCIDLVSSAWMCGGVQCGKTCCFVIFYSAALFVNLGPKLKILMMVLAPFSE